MKEVMKARTRTKTRSGKTLFGSRKFCEIIPGPPGRPREMNRLSVHAVRAAPEQYRSEGSRLDSSDKEGDLRRCFGAEANRNPDSRNTIYRPTRDVD